jgi:hypothetical protein
MVSRLVRLAAARGLDPAPLCAEAGIDPADLADPDARVPVAASDDLLERVAARLADDALGLSLAGVRDTDTYGVPGLLVLSSPTLADGLEQAFRYQRIWDDRNRFDLVRTARSLSVHFAPRGRPRAAHRLPGHAPGHRCPQGSRRSGMTLTTPTRRSRWIRRPTRSSR